VEDGDEGERNDKGAECGEEREESVKRDKRASRDREENVFGVLVVGKIPRL
jgi:hypothetical protein